MALTETYVDPSIAASSGSGTIGDPYGDLQYALDTMTRDSTNGDRINIKAGTDEIATASINLTTYGTPTESAPLVFEGYTSAAGDGGIGGVDGNNGAYDIFGISNSFVHYINLHIHNTQNDGIGGASSTNSSAYNVEVNDCGSDGILFGVECTIVGCHAHDIAGTGLLVSTGLILANYTKNDGTRSFTDSIRLNGAGSCRDNIISIDGSSNGITLSEGAIVIGNSVLSNAGTGVGINIGPTNASLSVITNNAIEGFSGVGGEGLHISNSGTVVHVLGRNAFYNNTTHKTSVGAYTINDLGDDETLSVSGFSKSGSDTFANRLTYFSPVDTGNMQTGGYPDGRAKGAIQLSGGGGGGLLTHPGMQGGMRG